MGQIADHVYTEQADIALIESRIVALPDEAIVELTMGDGRKLKGVVSTRPSIQTFRNPQGGEGVNALLRIDDLQHPEHAHYLWLDEVIDIVHIGSA